MAVSNPVSTRDIAGLRRELAQAERMLRETAEHEARRLADLECLAWSEAQDVCFLFDRIRRSVNSRLMAIHSGAPERFLGEQKLAEMALCAADRADAAYTVISFARLRDRLRYLRGGSDRESVVREALERGGIYTERHYFQGILR